VTDGKRIVVASWLTLGMFAIVSVLDAVGVDAFDTVAAALDLGLFLVSLPMWIYAFGLVLVRSTRGDDIAVGSWVFLAGSAPSDVRRHLMGATMASIVVAGATAWANPFAVLVPMLHLGFCALWGARHGTYPPRRDVPAARTGAAATTKGGRR
jgi:hypothetical protein